MTRFTLTCALVLLPTLALAQASPPVVVIAIDKKTQAALGPFGGSYRAHHAKLIEALNAAGARAIAFDVFFPENPEQAAGTQALADAARASKAPVVVGVLVEEQEDGSEARLDNAAVLQDPKIGQGAVLARRELFVRREGDDLVAETGALVIAAEAGGHPALALELLRRAGVADAARLESLGAVEPITAGWNGAEVKKPALRPRLGKRPRTVSYVDVLNGAAGDLRGALVVVGMRDGVQDVHERPDPARPELERVSGVYLHAALVERLVREVAEDDARRAREGAAAPAALGPGRALDGLTKKLSDAR